MQLRDAFLMPMLCSILRCFPCKCFHVKWRLRDDCNVVAAFCCCFFDFRICEALAAFFLFESVCVLAVVCVIAYGEMRRRFEYFEVVDGIAMIWLKGFCFLCWIV